MAQLQLNLTVLNPQENLTLAFLSSFAGIKIILFWAIFQFQSD